MIYRQKPRPKRAGIYTMLTMIIGKMVGYGDQFPSALGLLKKSQCSKRHDVARFAISYAKEMGLYIMIRNFDKSPRYLGAALCGFGSGGNARIAVRISALGKGTTAISVSVATRIAI